MNELQAEIQEVSWKLLPGNKFIRSMHPAMLQPGGYRKTMITQPIGKVTKQEYIVVYDEEYVIKWLISKLVKPLWSLDNRKIMVLVSAAMKHYQDELNGDFALPLRGNQYNEHEDF